MAMTRRALLAAALVVPPVRAAGAAVSPLPAAGRMRPRALAFPADHAAHPDTRVEWWYVTGWLRRTGARGDATRPDFGFQVTFFRTRTGLAEDSPSRFAPRQLVFAHVALTDLGAQRDAAFLHDQRVARAGFGLAAVPGPADSPQVVRLDDWSFAREIGSAPAASTRARIGVRGARFAFDFSMRGTQPLLLQGDAGYSRKGPIEGQASFYYSEPQLEIAGRLEGPGRLDAQVAGRAWLDHEWSDDYLAPEAVGWDWIGFNLFDGSALMAYRLRRSDGRAFWAGGSWRDAAGRLRIFAPEEVEFLPRRTWTSPRTQVRYPVEWQLETPAGRHVVAPFADDQELDSRGSTGALYWEGVSVLRDAAGRPLGWGYLELTGYGGRLQM
jgi:predicted secreted hydrolase